MFGSPTNAPRTRNVCVIVLNSAFWISFYWGGVGGGEGGFFISQPWQSNSQAHHETTAPTVCDCCCSSGRVTQLKHNLDKTIKNSKATRGNAEKVMNCTTLLKTLKLCVIRLYGESRRMHKATRALCIRGSRLDYLSKARWRNPQDHQHSHSCRPKLCAYFGSPAPDMRPYFVWINHESSAQPWWDVYLASSQNSLNVKQQRCYLQKHNRE